MGVRGGGGWQKLVYRLYRVARAGKVGGGQQKFNYRLLTLIFMLKIHVQFCGQRFRETSEVSGTETNSIEEGSARVAFHTGVSF